MFEDILIVSHAQDKKLELVVLGFIPLRPKIKKKERFYHFFEDSYFRSSIYVGLYEPVRVFIYDYIIGVRGNFQRGGKPSKLPEWHLKLPESTDFDTRKFLTCRKTLRILNEYS